jgi:hypothetical protein
MGMNSDRMAVKAMMTRKTLRCFTALTMPEKAFNGGARVMDRCGGWGEWEKLAGADDGQACIKSVPEFGDSREGRNLLVKKEPQKKLMPTPASVNKERTPKFWVLMNLLKSVSPPVLL